MLTVSQEGAKEEICKITKTENGEKNDVLNEEAKVTMVSQVQENTEEMSKEGQIKETCKSTETEANCTNALSEDGKTDFTYCWETQTCVYFFPIIWHIFLNFSKFYLNNYK